MNSLVLYSIIFLSPLAVLASGWHRRSGWALLLAALPPLAASLALPQGQVSTLHWLLLGSQLGTNAVTAWLLPATALVWAAAAVQHAASPPVGGNEVRFRVFFLLALSGNLLLLLAQDAITFYVGYALMGLAGYGLVMQRRTTNARVAGGTYLRWTIAGELLLFSGLVSLAHDTGSALLPLHDSATVSAWTLLLLIGGFGIKIGLPGLHAWMPGTYAASSSAGSAAFSGAMANAGVLGLLHFLPLQQDGYTTAGMILLGFGLLGAFYGVLLGLPQRHPKVILAYSSISQLGTLAALIGLALAEPALAPALTVAVTVYAVHHGLTKAALFLALDAPGKAGRRGLISIMLLLALSLMLAGLPFTSGAVAKALAKEAVGDVYPWLLTLLVIAGIGTALLMTRFMFTCLAPRHRATSPPLRAGAGTALLLLIAAHVAIYQVAPLPAWSVHTIWPLAIAMVLALAFGMLPPPARTGLQPAIPKGDLPILVARTLQRLAGSQPVRSAAASVRERCRVGAPKATGSGTPDPTRNNADS
jgi:formate hydrogenlyase subunit 3/multisubunit Na+/H+ antiporter MnhD subunit